MKTRSSAVAYLAAESEPPKRQKIGPAARVDPIAPPRRQLPPVPKLLLPSDHEDQLAGIANLVRDVFPSHLVDEYLPGLEEAIQIVDYYYRDYMPGESPLMGQVKDCERPRLVVISESHARTNPDLLGLPILDQYSHLVPKKYQKGHVNLVHSISYGEGWLAGIPKSEKGATAGTHQFWKLLCALAGMKEITLENLDTVFQHLLKAKTKPNKRIQEKVSILEKLEERKIKLIDMTPAYIYLASGSVKKPSENKAEGSYTDRKASIKGPTERAIIRYSWANYIQPFLAAQRPHNVIILGKSLTNLIGEKNIEKYTKSIGINYMGTRLHPSSHLKRPERIEELNNIRCIAENVQNA